MFAAFRSGGAKTLLPALILALAPPAPAADAAAPAPLPELLRLAEEQYPEYLARKNSVRAGEEAPAIARAELLPQASASLTEQHDAKGDRSWSADIAVTQSLFNLPRRRLWQAEQENVKTAALELAAARAALRRDVILAWLDVQQAAEVLQLVKKRRAVLQSQLERSEALAASGQVIEADVLSARAGLAGARSQLAQARHDLAVAHDAVFYYSGAAAAERPLAADAALPPLPPLQEWQTAAEENNLALQAARQNTAAIRRRLQAAAASVLPRLSLSGAIVAEDRLDNSSDRWQLSLQQSLFTGGNLLAQRRQLLAEADIAHAQIAARRAQTAQTVRRLHGQMRADLTRIAALREASAAAAALLQVVTVGYDNGVSIITEVLNAEEDLFDAQISLRQAQYSYLKNCAAMQELTGAGEDEFAAQIESLFISDPQ